MWFLFKKNSAEVSKETETSITKLQDGVFVSFRQASFALSGVLFVSFLCFITGYFLGKKAGFEQFTNDIMRDALSDKMYASFCALCDQNDGMTPPVGSSLVSPTPIAHSITSGEEQQIVESPAMPTASDIGGLDKIVVPTAQRKEGPCYCAHLVGFSTRKAAQAFVHKVKMKKGIPLFIKERYSKTARGKTISWYQVVTDIHNNQDNLKMTVERIQEVASLRDIHIVEIA